VDPFARTWLGFATTDPSDTTILTGFMQPRKYFFKRTHQKNIRFISVNYSLSKANGLPASN